MVTATMTGPETDARDGEAEARGQVVLTASADYRTWLKQFAKFLRVSGSTAMDHALMTYAESKGFRPPPPR